MQYLVQMKLVAPARPTSSEEGIAFIEQLILPTLECCKELQRERKIIAGGPMSGAVAPVLVVEANSARELEDLIASLTIWPRMATHVTPLTTFDDRAAMVRTKLEQLKADTRKAA
jgi:muconolactone delta-isomerase